MAQATHGVHVLNLTNNHTYELDEAALQRILLRDDVKDLPVVVVSVAGTFRGGKSFLLNFFLRYLTAPEAKRNESGDWLGAEDEELKGFSWRGGSERHTTGILMWPEPFITTLASGDKVAVLLMDTQGTYDSTSTVRDCSTIFALSTLISSVQIYNIRENLKEDDLQHLQLFTEYGKLVINEDGKKAFQILQFLIRDWPYEFEYSYGREGGEQLLAKRLEVTADMPAELREVRQHIRSCFETVTCFLMPHPGLSVRKKGFTGKISELDDEFKTAIKQLVPLIFSPANLTPKLINGERVKVRDLFGYIKTYLRIFNSDSTPTPTSIMEATAEGELLAAMHDAHELYDTRMERITSADRPSLPPSKLDEEHRKALAAAQTSFVDKKKMAPKKDSDECFTRLTQELQNLLPQFMLINEAKAEKAFADAKEAYETSVQNVHGDELLCLHPTDLQNIHAAAVEAALDVFDAKRQRYDDVQDNERTRLLQHLQKRLEDLRMLNDEHNKLCVAEAKLNFSSEMVGLLDRGLLEYQFRSKYNEAKDRAIAAFKRKRNKYSSYNEDRYQDELEQYIRNRFETLKEIYRSTRN